MNTPVIRRVLGTYEIVAGAGGILTVALLLPMLLRKVDAPYRVATISLFLSMACVFSVVLIAGLLLLRKHRWGVLCSMLVQAAQIPLWALGSSRWVFFAGAYLALLWQPDTPAILVGLKSNLEVNWQRPQDATFIGINLIPIVALYFLRRLTLVRDSAPIFQESARPADEIQEAVLDSQ